jgi:hypothetical protein
MAQQEDTSDYGVPDPNELLSEQQASYAQEMARAPNVMSRAIISGIGGLQNFNGGGPQMTEARNVQDTMKQILAQTNANAPEGEDPLTKQMRVTSAMANGLAAISPSAALKAQDRLVQLAQAKQQQGILSTKQEEAEETLKQEKQKTTIMSNTPQTIVLAQDQGKDPNGLPLGYKEFKTYDASDPNSITQLRADQAAAKENGVETVPMTMKELIDGKSQAAITRGQYQVQQAMIAAQSREQVAAQKTGSNSVNDRMTNRLMTATDMSATQLSNIASQNYGVSRGFFGVNASAGVSLMDMNKSNLLNALTPEDYQMYNAMAANLYRPLSMLETGGGLQGGQQFSNQIKQALSLSPTDKPLTVLTKLAEARQIIDTGSEVYLASKSVDPEVKAQVQQKLDALHQAVPWTPADVIAFKKAQETEPQLTFKEFALSLGVPGQAARAQATANSAVATPTAPKKDSNGTAFVREF